MLVTGVVSSAFSQGYLNFNNSTPSKVFNIGDNTGTTTSTLKFSTHPNLRFALYYGPAGTVTEAGLTGRLTTGGLISTGLDSNTAGVASLNTSTFLNGIYGAGSAVYQSPNANQAVFQVRAWDVNGGSTWEAFVNNIGSDGMLYGKTTLFNFTPGTSSLTPKQLFADGTLPFFQLANFVAIPEPSTYAMAGLGLSFLFMLRRRNLK